MLSLRTLTVSTLCALGSLACDAAPATQQAPIPAEPATPKPAAPAVDEAVGQAHYVKALEFESAGRYVEARAEVEQAIAAGAGRDAKLLAAKLAILRSDLDAAADLLAPLAADGTDALVHYNIGLVAQQRNQYNKARSAYLAALKAEPNYAPARFNLAVLAWDAGVREEAQHHARKFLELAPDDPRAAELRTRVELDGPPPADPATTPAATNSKGLVASPGAPRPDPNTGLLDPWASADKKQDSGLKNPFEGDKPKKAPATDGDLADPFKSRK